MALVPELNPQAFTNDSIVNFFGPHSNFGEPADVTPNGYASTDGLLSVSVLPVAAGQSIVVSTCSPLGIRCNMEGGTGLLVADNATNAPIVLRFAGAGIRAAAAFMLAAPLPDGTPFAPLLWATPAGGVAVVAIRGQQGVTGDIWTNLGDSVAPFVGVRATGSDRIGEIAFDVVHPTPHDCKRVGIGYLYYLL